jgi:Holliday junction resolvase RusA-like endonuclease
MINTNQNQCLRKDVRYRVLPTHSSEKSSTGAILITLLTPAPTARSTGEYDMAKLYVINVTPRPWKRPGLYQKRFFDAQSQEKLILGLALNQQHEGLPFYTKPISMDITFYMAIPRDKRSKPRSLWHMQRPDIDNLSKLILDAATGVLWADDKVIAKLCAQKIYDKDPRIEFTIRYLE